MMPCEVMQMKENQEWLMAVGNWDIRRGRNDQGGNESLF
jgi:hypothetical protein